jgi:flagellar biosynthesis protein FlhF
MTLETYAGPRVPALLAQAQAELGSNAIVVNVHRTKLPNGLAHFELTAADEASALALVSGPTPRPAESVVDPEPLPGQRAVPQVIALVGPTGSGKTMTIAKLALNQSAFGGRKVGLLSLDTHRAGGADQLLEYSSAAGIRMERAFQQKDLAKAKRRLRKCEVILVDTPGRGPAKTHEASAVTEMLKELAPHEVHLVLPEGMMPQHAERILAEYRWRGITHLLATKLDEYPGERTVEALAREHNLPVRWVCTGQDVPNNLVTVSQESAPETISLDGIVLRGASAA